MRISLRGGKRRGNFSSARSNCSTYWEPQIGAFVTTALPAARAAADRSGERWRAGKPLSPIDGMPVGIKDIIETVDMPTQMGSPLFAGWRSEKDAASVRALREAGAVILGKTVTTEFAASEPRGTRNPWNTAHTPGGSSSGSAAAVAAGIVSAALGTQVIGSTIRPASFCGCVGFKPSVNALNREGSHDYQSQSCTGVLGASLADVWQIAHEIVARVGGDAGTPGLRGPDTLPPAQRPRRLAVLETAGWDSASVAAKQQLGEAIMRLRAAGVEIRTRQNDDKVAALETDLLNAAELSHRCNGWETRWFLRSMRDRDAAKLSRNVMERAQKYEDLTLADHRADLRERDRAARGPCRARGELRRLHHARRAEQRAGGPFLHGQSGIRRAGFASGRAGAVAAAVRGQRHAARPAADRFFRSRCRRLRHCVVADVIADGGAVGARIQEAGTPMRTIDAFNHFFPKRYYDALLETPAGAKDLGKRVRGIPALSDIDLRISIVESFADYTQLLSHGLPPMERLWGPDKSPDMAKIANDGLAEVVAQHPKHFVGWSALLPMNAPEAAAKEAERALQNGANAVQLGTNANGVPLDAPEFLPIFEVIAKSGKPILLHPARTRDMPDYPTEKYSKYEICSVLGWPYETGVTLARLIFSGIMDRFPDLKVIAHHLGGVVPYLEGRVGHSFDQLGVRTSDEDYGAILKSLKKRPFDYFKDFYGDTAVEGARAATVCGLDFFGADHVLFASDCPFDKEKGPGYIRDTLKVLNSLPLSNAEREKIYFRNAVKLFGLAG